jgi:hypothetical protein
MPLRYPGDSRDDRVLTLRPPTLHRRPDAGALIRVIRLHWNVSARKATEHLGVTANALRSAEGGEPLSPELLGRILRGILEMDRDFDANPQGREIWSRKSERPKLKGGSKDKRDQEIFGINDPDFRKWWHRVGKPENGGIDIKTRQDAEEWYEYWKQLGKPLAKYIVAVIRLAS